MSESSAEETLGYVLLGVFFSVWLSGILSFQTHNFYTNYPNERKWLKAFVGMLIVVDGVQTIMGVAIIWNIVIRHPNDTSSAKHSTRLFQIYPVLVGLVSSSVQIFFAWRIKVLSANLILFAAIVALAIPQFAGGIAYTVLTVRVGYFAEFWNFNNVIIGWIAFSMVCDIVITTTLTTILRRHHTGGDLGQAEYLVHRIKIMTIQNGLVTIIWSLALLIALAAAKRGAHYMFFYPLGKVYLITMLASLNSRPVVRSELDPRIHSVLQRASSPRVGTPSLYSNRMSMDPGEKPGRPVSYQMRPASRATEYLPSTREEDSEEATCGHRNGRRQSNESADEHQPLVQESPPRGFTSPPFQTSPRMLNLPSGSRLPAPVGPTGRSASA